MVEAWLDYLSSEPRAAQLLVKDSPVVAALEQAMSRHLKDVKRHTFKADKRLVLDVIVVNCGYRQLPKQTTGK